MNILESHVIVFGADKIDVYKHEIDIWVKNILLFQYISRPALVYQVREDYFNLTENFPQLYHSEIKRIQLLKEVQHFRSNSLHPCWLKLHDKNNSREY